MRHDKYFTFDEMTEILKDFAIRYPRYMTLSSCGNSLEGREMWAVTLTDTEAGKPEDKPAMLVSACIHAGEITGTQVALYLIEYVLTHAGKDPYIDRILRTRTFYVLPRTNPDGAEKFITTEFESWGNLRPFLMDPETQGLERCDVDGNGILLLMRKKDPNGEWKISEKDARLMIPREPYEFDGEYYSIYPEGELVGDQVDPEDFKVLPRKWQNNMNRNYPDGWDIALSVEEGGAYPLSEPETYAVAHFIMDHRNIGTLNDLHTNAGVLIRPYSYQDDTHIPSMDLALWERLGEVGKQETGYDLVGVWDAFTPTGEPPRRGCLDDWTYNCYGILGITTELWDLAAKAGVGKAEGNYYPDQYKTEDEELTMLRWNDENLGGKNFINWKPFAHPQLGEVEIGGWNWKYTAKNPPEPYLEEECRKVTNLLIRQVNFLPELGLKSVRAEKLADDVYRVRVTVENAGFMPTYLTRKAIESRVAEQIVCELTDTERCTLIRGRARQEIGYAEGRLRMDRQFYFGDPTEGIPKKTATADWVLRACPGTTLNVRVISRTGGSFDVKVSLPE